MEIFTNIIVYFFLYLSLFFEVFLLVTYFERKTDIEKNTEPELARYPTVTIMVPVWNEEKTVEGTLRSLLALDYPKDKLKIMVVNDGSTDNTAEAIKKFENYPQIEIAHKPNGGKFTALNYGLERIQSEFVGCLDADSFVDPQALKRIIPYFDDASVMAVVPSIKIQSPTSIVHLIQNIEFLWGIFIRKMLSLIDALYVTPGPFSIFRKEVFDVIGPYRHAHNTEDLELALRMQANHYKIVNAHRAYVFTVPMKTVHKLYRQRLRWTYGFLKNAIDYKHLFFKKEHGALGLFILPMATVTIFSALYFTGMTLVVAVGKLSKKISEISTIGIDWQHWNPLDIQWFYVNTQVISFIGIVLFGLTVVILLLSKRMSDDKMRFSKDMLYFMTLYSFIAPFWLAKAVFNVLFSRETTWR